MATLSGSVSELCHISGESPTRPHQVPVTVLPGCPWEPRDTKAPFVPHHPGIRAIFIKVEGVRHGHKESMMQYHSAGLFLYKSLEYEEDFHLTYPFIIWLTLFMWFTIVMLLSSWPNDSSDRKRWFLLRHATVKCQGVGVWNGSIQTLLGLDAIFNLTRGVGVIWKVRWVH